ncbi:2-oxoacid:acceptor oxidoreductase subunit alpha [Sporolituus thermophilus]|uniref:2-oxoglutarate ferredoxin oxidoreductase subunit alpha n=1 Tax=Sporolituus thermophilus DSM 23256 TaxID=1123285 RepID=A0A1G7PN87_9FIRM|nr:2-oxoacid:acceptor oxidoreductase subunit alpha [Sporolituus thermophilus]SDF87713.1 2-oxoglutarate ferredoxin oxidoreductase subunit alpha [Sporolituus thermophilus DSM 23256]
MGKVLLLQGNQACAEGAIAAGVKFFAGYPITPSTEIAEVMAKRLPEVGGKFIQMEDEIASMGAIIGASLTGKKVLTATSGPGFSLKQELIGYAAIAEVPLVIANVQRVGPSTGQPTAPAQGDMMQARWGTHGDHPIIALTPASVPECFSLTIKAYELSEKYRTPVIMLLDEIVGHMRERIELPDYSTITPPVRKKPTVPPAEYKPYQPDEDLVPPMADFGTGYHWHVTGLVHDETGFPNGSAAATKKLIKRLHDKIEQNLDDIILYEEYMLDDAEIAIVTYGGTARTAYAAIEKAREQGIKVGMLRLITIWPFPEKAIANLAAKVRAIVVPELNYGQIVGEVKKAVEGKTTVKGLAKYDSEPISPQELLDFIANL